MFSFTVNTIETNYKHKVLYTKGVLSPGGRREHAIHVHGNTNNIVNMAAVSTAFNHR